jgi:hypothetical protein
MSFTVDGFTGIVDVGETLTILDSTNQPIGDYVILSHTETAGNTTTIVIQPPGFLTQVYDNYAIRVMRRASVNNGGGYPALTTTMTIDGYTGIVNNGEQMIMDKEGVIHTISGHAETGGNTTSITFAPGLLNDYNSASVTDRIVFAQGADSLFWCDGTGSIFGWDGTTMIELTGSAGATFTPDKVAPIGPKALVWFQNRLIAAAIDAEPDAIYFSDFLDPTSWDKNFQQVRVGGGDSDPITGLLGWTDLNLIVFKGNSIYVVNCDPSQNPDPTDITQLVSSFAIKVLSHNIGCIAPFTACQIGGRSDAPGSDVFFLANDMTVRSVRRTISAETQQQVGEPISTEPDGGIQDYLKRINRDNVGRSCAVYYDNLYLLAIPIDDATYPNIVLVFNTITQTWSGVWTGWTPTCFVVYLSNLQKVGMNHGDSTGHVTQWIDDVLVANEVDADYTDNGTVGIGGIGSGTVIPTSIRTRAYTLDDPFCPKTGMNVEFEFQDSAADVNIQAILDMVPSSNVVATAFSTMSAAVITLPITIPFILPVAPSLKRASFDLERYGQWRELQFQIDSSSKKLQMRSIRITGFIDSLVLQT